MALGPAHELNQLGDLDRRHLHVFCCGPGHGEGIAVALPERDWVLVDSCRCENRALPLRAVLDAWSRPSDRVIAMVLTHPHTDHCSGFPELLRQIDPPYVVLALPQAPVAVPDNEAAMWRDVERRARSYHTVSVAQGVLNALTAIKDWEERHAGALIRGHDGTLLDLQCEGLEMHARAPREDELVSLYANAARLNRLQGSANEFSLVFELAFGQTRVVLGSDLPTTTNHGKRVVPTGWNHVMASHPQLGNHTGLKIPHHGSGEAYHDELMTAEDAERERAWLVTPYNSSNLPSSDPDDGLDLLLRRERSVLLTALSARRVVQGGHPHPARVPLNEVRKRTEVFATGNWFVDEGSDLRVDPGSAVGPLDGVWCCAFDDQNHVVGRWRGPAALEVARG